MEATQDTHTNTRRPEVAVKCTLCISPIPDRPSSRTPPGAVGSSSAPRDQVNRPSRSRTARRRGQPLRDQGPSEPPVSVTDGQENVLFLHVFSVGVLVGGNPL